MVGACDDIFSRARIRFFFVLGCVWLMPTAVHGRLLALGLRGWAAWHRARVE